MNSLNPDASHKNHAPGEAVKASVETLFQAVAPDVRRLKLKGQTKE